VVSAEVYAVREVLLCGSSAEVSAAPAHSPEEFLRLEMLPALSAAHGGPGLRLLAEALHVPWISSPASKRV
jgi:hypothetical protein